MKRTNIYLRDDQVVSLRRRAQAADVTSSDLVRAAVDSWLAEPRAGTPAAAAPAAEEGRKQGELRPMSDFPASPEGWERRPYFVHDYDLSWGQFREILRGGDEPSRIWALARLLDRARWEDIWRLVTVEAVAAALPRLPVRNREMWDATLRQLQRHAA